MRNPVENAKRPVNMRAKILLDTLAANAYSSGVAKKSLTREEVIAILRKDQAGRSIREYAETLGISAPYLSDIFLGRRDPGPSVLKHFGLERHETLKVEYQPVA